MRDRVFKSSVRAPTCEVSTLRQRIYVHQPVDEPRLRKEQRRLDSPGMTGVKPQARQPVYQRARKHFRAAVLDESQEMPVPGDITEETLPAGGVAKDHDYAYHPSPAGFQEKTLSFIFEVSFTVSRIILTWTSYLYQVLGSLPLWMTREQVQAKMPDKFKLYCPQILQLLQPEDGVMADKGFQIEKILSQVQSISCGPSAYSQTIRDLLISKGTNPSEVFPLLGRPGIKLPQYVRFQVQSSFHSSCLRSSSQNAEKHTEPQWNFVGYCKVSRTAAEHGNQKNLKVADVLFHQVMQLW
ncbi:unnamed protein product [Leuciscus chuanchicus]